MKERKEGQTKASKVNPSGLEVLQFAIEAPRLVIPFVFVTIDRIDPAKAQKIQWRTHYNGIEEFS